MSKNMSQIDFEIDPNVQRERDAYREAELREEQILFRDTSTALGFYRACSDKRCRRATACLGDGEACYHRWWPHVHPEIRAVIIEMCNATRQGAPEQEARRRGAAAAEEWERHFLAGEFADEARAYLAGPLGKLPLLG